MNSDKLDQWQDEIKSVKIDGIDDMIRRKIEKQKANYYIRIVKTTLVSSLTVFIAFALLVNLSPQFYTFASNNRFLKPMAEMLKFGIGNNMKAAFDLNYAQEVNIKLVSGEYELDIDYAVFDIYSISLFGSMTYKGKPYQWKFGEFTPQIDLVDNNGDLVGNGGSISASKDYMWIRMEFIEPYNFEPIKIRFQPYESDFRKPAIATIISNPEKVVKLIIQPLNKSFANGNTKVTFNKMDVGAFQSRLQLSVDFLDNKQLSGIEIKYTYPKQEVIEVAESMDTSKGIYNLSIGQLMKPGPVTIELVSATFTEDAYTEIDFNLNTLIRSELPSYLTMTNLKKENSRITFTIGNSRGNSLLMEITSFFWGDMGISHDPNNPSETKFFIECNNQYAPNIKIRFRESITLPFDDAKFIVQW